MTGNDTKGTDMITVKEVAAILGVTPRTVWRLISQGDIPSYRISIRQRRIKRQDVLNYLESRRIQGS